MGHRQQMQKTFLRLESRRRRNSGPHGFEPVTTRHRAGDTDIVIASCMVLDFTKQLSPTAPTANFVVWMFTSVCVQLFKSLLCEGEGIQTEWPGQPIEVFSA